MFQLIIFCNISLILFATQRSKKKIHKSFEEMSFLLILVSYLSSLFQNFVEFSTTQDVLVLNLHQTIRLDNSVAAVNWREEGSHSLHL